jgi:hypothetical protein
MLSWPFFSIEAVGKIALFGGGAQVANWKGKSKVYG